MRLRLLGPLDPGGAARAARCVSLRGHVPLSRTPAAERLCVTSRYGDVALTPPPRRASSIRRAVYGSCLMFTHTHCLARSVHEPWLLDIAPATSALVAGMEQARNVQPCTLASLGMRPRPCARSLNGGSVLEVDVRRNAPPQTIVTPISSVCTTRAPHSSWARSPRWAPARNLSRLLRQLDRHTIASLLLAVQQHSCLCRAKAGVG